MKIEWLTILKPTYTKGKIMWLEQSGSTILISPILSFDNNIYRSMEMVQDVGVICVDTNVEVFSWHSLDLTRVWMSYEMSSKYRKL